MLFNSFDFLVFFPIVFILYYAIPQKFRDHWLLAASYYFYMCWNAEYALLLLASTVITYVSGLLLARPSASSGPFQEDRRSATGLRKKWIVAISLLLNLSILFFFKYANFAAEALTALFGKAGLQLNIPRFDVLLPVGISFYTFQALSYTMDVYRGEIRAEKNFFRYALFVSFFPQLVAGPIERSKNLLNQLAHPKKFSFTNTRDGLYRMLWGYFLKLCLADRIAIFVDTVYVNHAEYTGWYIAVATVLFAVQIYCDFAGYSAIALGAAKILGVDLMENFDAPYLSTTVAAFWRRWHISLTSWFRDYLYIPLGGSRRGKLRKYLNIMIVFLVSGLWHGASFSYVIWGGLNGFYQIAGEITRPLRQRILKTLKIKETSKPHRFLQGMITFLLIDFSWIFFRAGSFRDALTLLREMCSNLSLRFFADGSLFNCGLDQPTFLRTVACILLLLFADICRRKGLNLRKELANQKAPVRCVFLVAAVCFILIFGVWGARYDASAFIYFQF